MCQEFVIRTIILAKITCPCTLDICELGGLHNMHNFGKIS
jgi:hypothetical protein